MFHDGQLFESNEPMSQHIVDQHPMLDARRNQRMPQFRSPRCVLLLFSILTLLAPTAHGQAEFSRTEISGQFSTIRFFNGKGLGYFLGFGGRYDFNLNRRLALEAQVDFFPEDTTAIFQYRGGKTVNVVTGVRAKAYQSRNFAVYGLIRPGLLVFSSVPQFSTGPPGASPGVKRGAAAEFVLNLGGGVEYYPTPRLITRFEISGNPTRIANSEQVVKVCPPCQQKILPLPGSIVDTWRMSFGVGYRLGHLQQKAAEAPVSGKWEIGPQFSTLIVQRLTAYDGVRTEPGVGGFLSYRIFRFVYADTSLTFFPRDTKYTGVLDGGRIFQGFFGIRSGIRRDRFGLFAKVRPGLQTYSRTFTGFQSAPGSPANRVPTYGRLTGFNLDLGGVIEVYLPKRSLLRFDAGDSHPYYPDVTVNSPGQPPIAFPGGAQRHAIQLTVGYGWRF
jgi:hypothetical protein